ncbi:MAG: CFI-box-CTERM domain-containing protein [Suipraeoptans sp.]
MNESMSKKLTDYFDEMIKLTPDFKKKTYSEAFETMNITYKPLFTEIMAMFSDMTDEESEKLVKEVAFVIPNYAKSQMNEMNKRTQEKRAIDYNLTMAVYVIPGLSYNRNEKLIAIAKSMVEQWNEIKVTNLSLSYSNYEDIDGGFKRKLCFITTAVCEGLGKADDCYELNTLREYRDNYLMSIEEGHNIIEEYYDIAPAIVMMMNMENNNELYSDLYRGYIKPCIKDIEMQDNENCKLKYINMVESLKSRYYTS